MGSSPEDYPKWKTGPYPWSASEVIDIDVVEAELKEVEEEIKHFEDRAGNAGSAEE